MLERNVTETEIKLLPVADSRHFRDVLGRYPTGVCVVTATGNQGVAAMVVGSFTSASLDPPLIAFLPDRTSATWPRIREAGRFCVNILADDQVPLCRQLSSRGEERLSGLTFEASRSGSALIGGAAAWIECSLDAVHEAGDHYIVLGRVEALGHRAKVRPLLFYRGGYGGYVELE